MAPESQLPAVVNQHVSIIRVCAGSLDAGYLLAYLGHPSVKTLLDSLNSGGSRRAITKAKIEQLPIPLPPLPTQRRIGAALSAYDDLIENNTRRIRVLEEMARALYREWFVHFRYPGHSVGSTGLPAGWEKLTLGGLANLLRESISPNEEPDTEFDLLSFEACDEGRIPIVTKGASILSSKFRVSDGAVLLPKLNPHIPRVWLPFLTGSRPPICSTEYMVLSPRRGIPRTYVYATVEGVNFSAAVAARADGTSNSHKRLKPDDVLNRPVVKPSAALLEKFDAFAGSAYEACDKLRRKNTRLRSARDLLLPKLLSGQLSVERIPDPAEAAGGTVPSAARSCVEAPGAQTSS